jgi:hypothetical protein
MENHHHPLSHSITISHHLGEILPLCQPHSESNLFCLFSFIVLLIAQFEYEGQGAMEPDLNDPQFWDCICS